MDAASEMRRLMDLLTDEVSDQPLSTAIEHVDRSAELTLELVRRVKKRLMLQQNKAPRKNAPAPETPPPAKPKLVKSGDKPSSVTTDAPSLPTGNRPTANSYSAGSPFGFQPAAPSSPSTNGTFPLSGNP